MQMGSANPALISDQIDSKARPHLTTRASFNVKQ
jgi:hypothetical protein